DAISDQTIDDGDTMTGTRTQTYGGTVSGPNLSVTGNGDYTAKEGLTINSDSTVDVNVAQNTDTQSGGYSSDASEDQIANYNETGHSTGQYMNEDWTFHNHQEHWGSNDDSGEYSGGDPDVLTSGGKGDESETRTFIYLDKNGNVVSSITVPSGGSNPGSSSSTTEDTPAEPAPVDPQAGDVPAAHADDFEFYGERLARENESWVDKFGGVVEGAAERFAGLMPAARQTFDELVDHPIDTSLNAVKTGWNGLKGATWALFHPGKAYLNSLDENANLTANEQGKKLGGVLTDVGVSYAGGAVVGRVGGAILGRSAAAADAANAAHRFTKLAVPVLRSGSIREMFGQMQAWMRANRSFSQAQLADFFEGMAQQISKAHPNWQANRMVLSDGTIAFIGEDAANVFAIRANGQMLQSNPAVGALRFNRQTNQYELIYSAMRTVP
ncbi:MAG: hypothetical protein ACREHD_17800, partial [Pirellulales bacterium]